MPIALVQALDAQNLWIHEDHGDYLFCQLRHYPTGVCETCDEHRFGCLHAPYVTITREQAQRVIFETHEMLTRIQHQMHRPEDEYWTWRGTRMLSDEGIRAATAWDWPEKRRSRPIPMLRRIKAAWILIRRGL